MATYKYTQDFFDGHNDGYVSYNITPDFNSNTYVTSETPIAMQIELKNTHFVSNSFVIAFTDGNNISTITIDINIPKSTVVQFGVKFYLKDMSGWDSNRNFYVYPYFHFFENAGGVGPGEFTTWNIPAVKDVQRIAYLRYDIKPSIDNLIFDRYDEGEIQGQYVKNDEGQYVFGTLKISLADGYNESDVGIATVQVSDGTNVIYTKNLKEIQGFLASALSQNGYVENAPTLFSNVSFDSSIDYTITFTIGDSYALATSSTYISRAFANIHLSGQKTGGVAFGRFSSSKENDPKFENEYPSYLYGGISEVGNVIGSLMAFGIQTGTVASSSISDDSAVVTSVVFKRKYTSAPSVICGISQPPSSSPKYIGSCSVAVGNITKDGFDLLRANRSGHSVQFGASWIAVGQPNTDPNSWGVITVTRPASAMTSNNSQNCIATASSEYSSKYKAYQAFSSNREKGWASLSNDQSPWIQLEMDVALKNVVVSVYSRDNSSTYNPTDGYVSFSNDGVSWSPSSVQDAIDNAPDTIFENWSASAKNALLGIVECKNTTAYKYVRINILGRTSSSHYAAIGHITIEGDYEDI